MGPSAAILDYGCGYGYGRTLEELEQQGFDNLSGVDASPGMITRARSLHPAMRFAVLDIPPTLAWADASIDVVVLFAVLTCIPSDEAQRRLIGELYRESAGLQILARRAASSHQAPPRRKNEMRVPTGAARLRR
ncbi:class I SAM-dependent methyltransferase [Streptomyces sp. NBC_01236]|uniref:class I SAM-dependent methyltransferase n=1 Tax=Streptomyces sp. NBC_01236 TaxID=2903789 RepID=UPI002E1398BE|nr:class I SAM-dependent methyltransferase [Streptomyces sp. NBC_01236]